MNLFVTNPTNNRSIPDSTTPAANRALTTRLLVVGGGPAGLVAAASFARYCRSVLVVDPRKSIEQRSKSVLLNHRAATKLEQLGLNDLLAEQAMLHDMQLWVEGRRVVTVPLKGFRVAAPFRILDQWRIEERLRLHLATKLPQGNLLWGWEIVSLKKRGRHFEAIACSEEQRLSITTDLVVIADGARRPVTALFSKPPRPSGRSYFLSALTIETDEPLATPHSMVHSFLGSTSLSLFPTSNKLLRAYCHPPLSRAGAEQLLRQHFGGALGNLRVCEERTFRAAPSFVSSACRSHVAIIGDASHVLSPTTGQGMNKAINEGARVGRLLGKFLDSPLTFRLFFTLFVLRQLTLIYSPVLRIERMFLEFGTTPRRREVRNRLYGCIARVVSGIQNARANSGAHMIRDL